MSRKLWIVTGIYEFFVALPSAVMIGTAVGGAFGFLAFLGITASYITVLLLLMGLIDYARAR